jgi:hypothetical protein
VNPIWNFIILKKKNKKKNQTHRNRKEKKKKNQPTADETQLWVLVAGHEVSGRGRDPSGKTQPFRPDPSLWKPKKSDPRWVALAGRGWLVGLLSFSQIISLSLLNDKKKEEGRRKKKHGRGRREEMGEKKKKEKI